jgi:putative membrane protein
LKHFFLRPPLGQRLSWLAAALFLVVNGWFVANLQNYAELREAAARPEVAVVSVVFVLAFAAPAFAAAVRWLGLKRGAALIGVLGIFAVSIETFALHTGIPYGRFSYGDKIGTQLPGGVPWTVCFAWSPLLLGAMTLTHRQSKMRRVSRCLWAAALLTAFDGVLDPGAVSQNYWRYDAGGLYYGVPFSNFCGWLLSGFVGAWIFSVMTRDAKPPVALVRSALLILLFWTSVCAWSLMVVPALLGVVLLLFAFRSFFSGTTEFDRTLSHETS